jgi:hypothetical protein
LFGGLVVASGEHQTARSCQHNEQFLHFFRF